MFAKISYKQKLFKGKNWERLT